MKLSEWSDCFVGGSAAYAAVAVVGPLSSSEWIFISAVTLLLGFVLRVLSKIK